MDIMDAHTIPAVFTENASYACEDILIVSKWQVYITPEKKQRSHNAKR